MKSENYGTEASREIRLARRSPTYWRVTFDHPPLNIFGPETIPQLNEIVTALETDEQVKVVVFDSAVDGFFLTHYDFLASPEETTSLPPGPTGLAQLPDLLVRLSRAPVVSIVSVRGRATGVGSELALASDMRFASREKAIFSQFEVGVGLVPGGGPMARLPRLIGRDVHSRSCSKPTISRAIWPSSMATSIAHCLTLNSTRSSTRSLRECHHSTSKRSRTRSAW
jgi:enoyl-CoA hydratase/carnithine racemase